jgi:DNA-binding HxlR family transcriptional regulator
MTDRDHLGVPALRLLAEEWTVAILELLADGPLSPADVERRLPDAPHSVVMRRLQRLLADNLVSRERQLGAPPRASSPAAPSRAYYSLTDAGRGLLAVAAEAGRWERTWYARAGRAEPAGVLAIRFLADEHVRKIMLVVADRPRRMAEIDGQIHDLSRSALHRRLRELTLAGLLERRRAERARRYEMTPSAQQLAAVVMLAAYWELEWRGPEPPPRPS